MMKNATLSTGVVEKAIRILDVFAKTEKPVGITELATLTNLNVSTAYRIANVFVNHGYLQQEGKRGKYTLGLKFLKFKSIVTKKMDIRQIAYPFLEELRTVTGESINLAVPDGGEAVYIEHIESNHTLRTFTTRGNRVPLYCTGVGKVFCAFMDNEKMHRLVKEPFTALTKNTIADIREFEKELAKVLSEGVALDNGEMEIDVRCIAAPIFDANGGVIGSVSISGPYTRLPDSRIAELKPIVKESAARISTAMGFECETADRHPYQRFKTTR